MRWMLALLAVSLCVPAFAQGGPAAEPPGGDKAPMYKLDFAGGKVGDLVNLVQSTIGERVVARRAYERDVPALKIPDPEVAGDMTNMLSMGMASANVGEMGPDGANRERIFAMLAPQARVGVRPGWLFAPSVTDEALIPPKAREMDPKRDGEVIPFVRFEAITAQDLLDQLFGHARLPLIVDPSVELPTEPFPVDLGEMTIDKLLAAVAEKLGVEATPVWVAYDLTEDLGEFLESVTDAELNGFANMFAMWNDLSEEQRKALMSMIYGRFSQLPTDQRQMMLAGMQFMLNGLAGRMGSMDPASAAQFRSSMQGFMGDLSGFYGGLGSNQRSELSGLFGAFGNLMGGSSAGGGGGRPGVH